MPPRFRPMGKTFKERWPHEAEETRYLASVSYAVVVGGVLGVLLFPLGILHALTGTPVLAAVILGLLVLITVSASRTTEPARRWLALAWKIGVWILAAAALGLLVESILGVMCDDACAAALGQGQRRSPLLITYGILVAGSVAAAMLADRGGNALRRRTPSVAAPR